MESPFFKLPYFLIRRLGTWLKDKSLTDLDNLPDPDELAQEIVENLEAGLESFKSIL